MTGYSQSIFVCTKMLCPGNPGDFCFHIWLQLQSEGTAQGHNGLCGSRGRATRKNDPEGKFEVWKDHPHRVLYALGGGR